MLKKEALVILVKLRLFYRQHYATGESDLSFLSWVRQELHELQQEVVKP